MWGNYEDLPKFMSPSHQWSDELSPSSYLVGYVVLGIDTCLILSSVDGVSEVLRLSASVSLAEQ